MNRPRKRQQAPGKSKQPAKSKQTQQKSSAKKRKIAKPDTKSDKKRKLTNKLENENADLATADDQQSDEVPLVCERTRFIGPVIRITKTKANATDGQCTFQYELLNKFPLLKNQSSTQNKAIVTSSSNQKRQPSSSYRGIHSNSISNSSSESGNGWKCSLCKREAHELALGDLYGPYYVDELVNTGAKGKPEIKVEEIWLHEDCVVWLPNVFTFNGRLVNLQSAISDAALKECVHCSLPGATMACFERKCSYSALHFPCARQLGCQLDESTFTTYCYKHRKPPQSQCEVLGQGKVPN